MLLVVSVILVMALTPALALAGSPDGPNLGEDSPNGGRIFGGVVKSLVVPWADGELHIVDDPLDLHDGSGTGNVIFWCDSNVGLQYHIVVSGLDPHSSYAVSVTGTVDRDLGTLHTDAKGMGSVRGVEQLEAGRYELIVEVRDGGGTLVLDSHLDDQGFSVVR
jgi:hypothetical protein